MNYINVNNVVTRINLESESWTWHLSGGSVGYGWSKRSRWPCVSRRLVTSFFNTPTNEYNIGEKHFHNTQHGWLICDLSVNALQILKREEDACNPGNISHIYYHRGGKPHAKLTRQVILVNLQHTLVIIKILAITRGKRNGPAFKFKSCPPPLEQAYLTCYHLSRMKIFECLWMVLKEDKSHTDLGLVNSFPQTPTVIERKD